MSWNLTGWQAWVIPVGVVLAWTVSFTALILFVQHLDKLWWKRHSQRDSHPRR